MPQNRFGFLVITCGPGNDAVDGHRADHQRHHRIRRNAEREQRNERGLRAGIVGALGSGHALDGAAAEAARILGELLLERVGGERPEHRAVAGQDAEDRADDRAAQHGLVGLLEVVLVRQQPADGLAHHVAMSRYGRGCA